MKCTAAVLLLCCVGVSDAYNNGMARTPPMGWQTWCSVGPCGEDHCNDKYIRDMADTLVSTGMQKLGYEWIVLDDCWHPTRDNATGELVAHKQWFPDGMKPTIDYVHSLKLKFGLYTSVGTETCHGGWSPGSFGHYTQDANTFAKWGADYVKMDYCGSDDSPGGHANFSKALNATGWPMIFALCRGPYQSEQKWGYAPKVAQVWRATGDHHDSFDSVLKEVKAVTGRSTWSSPGNWAYLDMMMTGGQGCKSQCVGSKDDTGVCNFTEPMHCPGQSDAEYRTEASLYTIVSSPIMVGTDIRLMTPIMKELLLNPESIAINQDAAAVPGDEMVACTSAPMPPPPKKCSVQLLKQISKHKCKLGRSFGCSGNQMTVADGCRGTFTCNGHEISCGKDGNVGHNTCVCHAGVNATAHAFVRHLSNGNLAVALANVNSSAAEPMSVCLSTVGWKNAGKPAKVRDVWNKKDLAVLTGDKLTATVGSHDTLLLVFSPAA